MKRLDPLRSCSLLTAVVACLLFGGAVDYFGWGYALLAMLGVIMSLGARNLYIEWPRTRSSI